ncbi:RepA leader peptide Tap [Klebsiella pneumoniae]
MLLYAGSICTCSENFKNQFLCHSLLPCNISAGSGD